MAQVSLLATMIVVVGALQSFIQAVQAQESLPGSSSYVVSAGFPTSVFSSYYDPITPTQEPQPALYDPVLDITYPRNLTDPNTLPSMDNDPIYFPKPVVNVTSAQAKQVIADAISQIKGIIAGPGSNCTKCQEALKIGQNVSLTAPEMVPAAFVELCISTKFKSNSSCEEAFAANTFGATWTTVLAFADVSGHDGQAICNSISNTFCKAPPTVSVKNPSLFPKPKPKGASAPKPSGKRIKVAHLSDFHLDPRYYASAEANCSGSLCCRTNTDDPNLPMGQISVPAPLYGAYKCDTPYYLGLAALQSVGPLTGTSPSDPLAFTVYTGDLVSHDPQSELSRAYTEYAEDSIYTMFKKYLTTPVFPVLGNHDSNPEAIDAPHSLPGPLGQQFSWNYNHVADLWKHNGWISDAAAAEAKLHYAAYSIKNHYGLRIITLNTDFWYRSNFYNFIDVDNPDVSGTFSFMIQELQAAEDAGERVWILGHVLSGWDGTNPVPNPTDLFYQIVDRYSPHVIANIFFGHTHEDQFMIYYANNATSQTADNALTTGWIGPSVTPLTNLNSGFRMYEVDTGSFDIYDAYTWYADVNSFPTLDTSTTGPTYKFEYSTRDAYPIGWPEDAPLNATYWHKISEAMETNLTMTELFNTHQGKSSVKSPKCNTTACAEAKVCYMRSGSAPLGKQCPQGYGSVQSAFKPTS